MEYVTHTLAHLRVERVISVIEWSLLAVLFSVYAYFVVMTVVHVVLRQEYMVAIENTEAHVSELEAQYLAHERELSGETAAKLGMVELQPVAYVDLTEANKLSRRP